MFTFKILRYNILHSDETTAIRNIYSKDNAGTFTLIYTKIFRAFMESRLKL